MDEKYRILHSALKEIVNNYGHVCEEFEICKHASCQSSYGAWETANKALKQVEGTWKDTTTPIDDN